VPKPTSRAISSTGASLFSSSASAAARRWPISHACGEVPVVALNRRAKHQRAAREGVDADVLGEVRTRPLEDDAQQVVLAGRHRGVDELGLAAVAVRGDDHLAGQGVGRRSTPLTPHEVQQRVDARGCAGPGDDLPVVDVEDRGVDVHLGEAGGELAGPLPVRGDPLAVQQPGGGQDEGAGAVADDDGATGVGGAEGVEQRRGRDTVEQFPGGDRDDVRPRQPLEAVLDRDRDAGVGAHDARRLADQSEVEARQAHVPAVVAEHLGADAEPETADETVGHDHADDQGTVGVCHATSMAEKMR
jgi:hypothetical protein